MMMPKKKLIRQIIMQSMIFGNLIACASYPNDPRAPLSKDDAYTVEEDGFLSVPEENGILVNDKPREGTGIVIKSAGEQQTDGGGLLVLAANGSFTYEPADDFFGTDQLKYTIGNEKGKQTDGVVSFYVTPVNDFPEARDDIVDGPVTGPIAISVLDNDVDLDGDQLQIIAVGNPVNGSAVHTGSGVITYTPPADHNGPVKFNYTVADAADERDEAWVTLTVAGQNSGIVANPDTVTVAEDTSATLTVSDILANDLDQQGGDLSLIELTEAQSGMVVRDGSTIVYSPNADFFGTDSFAYTVQSQRGTTASSTVTVTVTPVNDPPTISQIPDQTVLAGRTTPYIAFSIEDLDNPLIELIISARVTDADPPNLLPANSITLSGRTENRAIRIATRPNIAGRVTITITASDEEMASTEEFVLTVALAPPPTDDNTDDHTDEDTDERTDDEIDDRIDDDAAEQTDDAFSYMDNVPVLRSAQMSSDSLTLSRIGGLYTTAEDYFLTIPAVNGILADHADFGKHMLYVTSLATMDSYYGGEVKMASDGSFSYRPPANFTGQDHFQYTIGKPGSSHAVFTQKAVIMVNAVNDAPLAADDLYGLAAGETLVLGAARGVLANDRDVEDQPLKVIAQHNSRLTLNADGSFSYAPPAGFIGKERFNYVVSDQHRRATATLTLMVGPNRAPLVRQDGYRVGSGQAVGIGAAKGLLANDKDPEERALSIAATGVFDTLFGGEVNIGPKGGFTYLPPPNFDGFDSFTYSVSDGSHHVTGSAVVSVSP